MRERERENGDKVQRKKVRKKEGRKRGKMRRRKRGGRGGGGREFGLIVANSSCVIYALLLIGLMVVGPAFEKSICYLRNASGKSPSHKYLLVDRNRKSFWVCVCV